MDRRTFLKNASLAITALPFISGCSPLRPSIRPGRPADETRPDQRPNIIFLMDDQHRWDALGVIDPATQTPTLDRLARTGVLFDQTVCQAPMCIPSRNSMMLGLYPNQTTILRNGRGLSDDHLPAKPLPQALKDAGYFTAGFGKTHWGTVCSTRGFQIRYASECREKGAVMMIDDAPQAKARYDAETKPFGPGEEDNSGYLGCTSKLPESDHRDGWVTQKCLEFIENYSPADPRPLFLYLSFMKPHAGMNIPAGFEDRYDPQTIEPPLQPDWPQDRSPHAKGLNRSEMYIPFWSQASRSQWQQMIMRYRANVTWMDDMFGRVLQALKQKGLLDNALIVFVSDHGEMLGERYYRFNKYCLYESSVRVPLILSGSALPRTLRHTVDHRPAELVDLYPTLLKVAQAQTAPHAVGLDLLSPQTRPASFSALHERPGQAAFMWRTARHKLILVMNRKDHTRDYSPADIIDGELYNLAADPREWNNLYLHNDYQPIKEKMTRQLLNHLHTL